MQNTAKLIAHVSANLESEMELAKQAVVIYHGADCMDGFGAAWAFHMWKEVEYGSENVQYIPCNYGQDIFSFGYSFVGRDVYIVDFSFSREVLTMIAEDANYVLVLDHHKTAEEALENWGDKPVNMEIVFDMKKSGAGLTWDRFSKGLKVSAYLINYIEDRDLWRFALWGSKEINAYIAQNYPGQDANQVLAIYMQQANFGMQQQSMMQQPMMQQMMQPVSAQPMSPTGANADQLIKEQLSDTSTSCSTTSGVASTVSTALSI